MGAASLIQAAQQASSTLALPADTYIYKLARSQQATDNNIACIASPSSLVHFDSTTLSVTRHVAQCHDSVTALAAAGDHFATAGRDSLVKLWDARAKDSKATITLRGDGKGFSAVTSSGHLIAAGTENARDGPSDVHVVVWDVRSPGTALRTYADSHNDTITALTFHPTLPSRLLSSSTDALLTLFDTSIADEDDAVAQVFNHAAAVHCAAFLAPDEIAAISSDEQMGVYQLSRTEDIEREDVVAVETKYGDVREELSASYVVDLVQAAKAFEPETWIVSGDLESKALTITPVVRQLGAAPTKWMFEHRRAITFPGAHGEEVVRDVLVLPDSRVLTCGEDGAVRAWSVPGSAGAEAGEMDVDTAEGRSKKDDKHGKKRKKHKREQERFNPY